ncbi:MAG: DHH family phosphoesterase [Spirochaetia bacterium]
MERIQKLLETIDRNKPLIIQAHDYPDHDAVASAYALGELFNHLGIQTQLCYSGSIQSESLKAAIDLVHIPIGSCSALEMNENTQIIVVDGFAGNTNVTSTKGRVIGVVDHHHPPSEPDFPYADIRKHIGSCSAMIYGYYRDLEVPIKKEAATALLMGIMMDTAFMTRGVAREDMEAFSGVYFLGDWELGSRILKNSLSLNDLPVFKEAIETYLVDDYFCFAVVRKECTPEVLALLGDFFLGIREIHFVVVVVFDRDEYRISVRSEDVSHPADEVIRKAISGIGTGGGHLYMGGGSIPHDLFPGEQGLRKRFLNALEIK